jgi:hypothetical protein
MEDGQVTLNVCVRKEMDDVKEGDSERIDRKVSR